MLPGVPSCSSPPAFSTTSRIDPGNARASSTSTAPPDSKTRCPACWSGSRKTRPGTPGRELVVDDLSGPDVRSHVDAFVGRRRRDVGVPRVEGDRADNEGFRPSPLPPVCPTRLPARYPSGTSLGQRPTVIVPTAQAVRRRRNARPHHRRGRLVRGPLPHGRGREAGRCSEPTAAERLTVTAEK